MNEHSLKLYQSSRIFTFSSSSITSHKNSDDVGDNKSSLFQSPPRLFHSNYHGMFEHDEFSILHFQFSALKTLKSFSFSHPLAEYNFPFINGIINIEYEEIVKRALSMRSIINFSINIGGGKFLTQFQRSMTKKVCIVLFLYIFNADILNHRHERFFSC